MSEQEEVTWVLKIHYFKGSWILIFIIRMNILSYFIIRQNGLELVDLVKFVNFCGRIVGKIFNSFQICTSIYYHKATNRNEKTRGKVVYLKCALLCVLSFIITVILIVTLTYMPALLENITHRG